jgi:transcriptional regulator with XRE-family HTH domain
MNIRPLRELAEYRERQDPPLSQEAFARQMGITKATVSRWEAGKRRPDRKYVPMLAEITGVTPLELTGLD